ncbi:MAG: hypothetical protein ACXWUL_04055 [Caldimonas sp.]
MDQSTSLRMQPIVGLRGSPAASMRCSRSYATPADTGLAFVVVMHLAPDHGSMLAETVEAHHGTLTAASGGRDRGATFTIELPLD